MMEAEFFAFEDISWQTVPPPDRHPVPVAYLRDLQVGDEVTIGAPGRYFIDGQILLRSKRETVAFLGDGKLHESVAVCAPTHYWTWKVNPRWNPVIQWWPVEYTWRYRDAVSGNEAAVAADPSRPQTLWWDRVRLDVSEPPVLRPMPAREAGALTGRPLRSRNAVGEWFWFIGGSEPLEADGEVCVRAVPGCHWWLHQVGYYPELQERVRTIPLHRLFAYA